MTARRAFVVSVAVLTLDGCARAPAFNILGSFFPAWLACMAAGILLTVIVRLILSRWGWEERLRALPLVYLSMAILFACILWLLFFE